MSTTTLRESIDGPRLSDQVCYALYSTGGAVTQAYSQLLAPYQLSYPQFVIMMGLWQNNGVSVTQLSAIVGLTKATLTPILRKLETSGFLQRKRIPGNERTMTILLTDKGRAFAEQARDVAEQALCATGLSSDEAEQLIALCSKIRSNLKEESPAG